MARVKQEVNSCRVNRVCVCEYTDSQLMIVENGDSVKQ